MSSRISNRRSVITRDDEDEEMSEQERAPPKTVQSRRKKRVAAEGDDGDEATEGRRKNAQESDDNDEGQRFDPSTFTDQPLDGSTAARKLETFVADWTTVSDRISEAFPLVNSVGISLEDVRDSAPQTAKTAAKLEETLQKLIDAQREVAIHQEVLRDMSAYVKSDKDVTDVVDVYEKRLKAALNDYKKRTPRQKYGKEENYVNFRQEIWAVNHGNEAMKPVKHFIEKVDGDSDSDDSEVEMGGQSQNFTCPLTMVPFKDPMTSKICQHSFSKAPLMEFFKKGGTITCPAAGCSKKLGLADFKPDKVLARRTFEFERRKKVRAADQEDEEDDMDVL